MRYIGSTFGIICMPLYVLSPATGPDSVGDAGPCLGMRCLAPYLNHDDRVVPSGRKLYGRSLRPQNVVAENRSEPRCQLPSRRAQCSVIRMPERQRDDAAVRRIAEQGPFPQRILCESFVISRGNLLQYGIFGLRSLYNHDTLPLAPARPSGNLGQGGKGAFRGSEIGKVQKIVRIQNPDHRKTFEIESFW